MDINIILVFFFVGWALGTAIGVGVMQWRQDAIEKEMEKKMRPTITKVRVGRIRKALDRIFWPPEDMPAIQDALAILSEYHDARALLRSAAEPCVNRIAYGASVLRAARAYRAAKEAKEKKQ